MFEEDFLMYRAKYDKMSCKKKKLCNTNRAFQAVFASFGKRKVAA